MPGDGGDFVPARASGRASLQEMWGLSSDRVTLIVRRVTERTIGLTSKTGYLEDPGRDQLCTMCTVYPDA